MGTLNNRRVWTLLVKQPTGIIQYSLLLVSTPCITETPLCVFSRFIDVVRLLYFTTV